MKKQIYQTITGTILLFFLLGVSFAQTVTLTFTGRHAANQYVQLERVVITNLTKGWCETLVWPDTVLTMQDGTGISDAEKMYTSSLQLSQNNPNPFNGTTNVNLTVVDAGAVTLEIADVNGRIVETWCTASLQMGINQFRISLSAASTYVLTARQNGKTSSIKMVCNGAGNGNRIEYAGIVETWCTSSLRLKSTTTNPFTLGDQMEYVGYATINGVEVESQHVMQAQNASQTFVLLFAASVGGGQPCPDMPTVTDIDGNVYNTVQIGNQCWMKENLRTTRYDDNTFILTGDTYSNTDPYRYAPNNDESNVATYGYLYNWLAVVHGICPNGWHVPSDAEWSQLTNYVSGQSEYVCGTENYIAKALSATLGWYEDEYSDENECAVANNQSANNVTGFSVLPAGYYGGSGCHDFGGCAYFWSATVYAYDEYFAYARSLCSSLGGVYRNDNDCGLGFSVRCVRD
ncbi:MAG: T9SS type A sorting domain-containing protein [Bacteroidales bacterium]|nr:T9SS type A sorting domain-containing protein [Bacteroidales bacterium]